MKSRPDRKNIRSVCRFKRNPRESLNATENGASPAALANVYRSAARIVLVPRPPDRNQTRGPRYCRATIGERNNRAAHRARKISQPTAVPPRESVSRYTRKPETGSEKRRKTRRAAQIPFKTPDGSMVSTNAPFRTVFRAFVFFPFRKRPRRRPADAEPGHLSPFPSEKHGYLDASGLPGAPPGRPRKPKTKKTKKTDKPSIGWTFIARDGGPGLAACQKSAKGATERFVESRRLTGENIYGSSPGKRMRETIRLEYAQEKRRISRKRRNSDTRATGASENAEVRKK